MQFRTYKYGKSSSRITTFSYKWLQLQLRLDARLQHTLDTNRQVLDHEKERVDEHVVWSVYSKSLSKRFKIC